jgi:hypothetical protein
MSRLDEEARSVMNPSLRLSLGPARSYYGRAAWEIRKHVGVSKAVYNPKPRNVAGDT